MAKEKILIIGANGQIGSVLTTELRKKYGEDAVVATDIYRKDDTTGLFEVVDVLQKEQIENVVKEYAITQVYHLAAILSAKGELNPKWAWDINMNGLFNVLDIAKDYELKVFFPSSIAVFGSMTPADNTPQQTVIHPETVYGISKAAGENWAKYYYEKYGVDVRSVRYPGIIGYQSQPGGGTTDYAVDIYFKAVEDGKYESFLSADTALPMMYMEDAIRATIELMEAPAENIKTRTSYNLAGISFTPAQVAAEIQKHIPNFEISYAPDFRQGIADTWPNSINETEAQEDWNWQHKYDLEAMTADMIENIQAMKVS